MYIRTSVYIFIHMYTFLITIVPLSVYVLVHVTYIRVMKTPVSSAGDTPLEALEGSPGYQVIRHEGAKEGSRGPQYAKQRRITERRKRRGKNERIGKRAREVANEREKRTEEEKKNEEKNEMKKTTEKKKERREKRTEGEKETQVKRTNKQTYEEITTIHTRS